MVENQFDSVFDSNFRSTMHLTQGLLFPEAAETDIEDVSSTTFVNNMSLPVHRWFRYSAGFSAEWVSKLIREAKQQRPTTVFDPFAGSGTTLISAETEGVASFGIDSHPFVSRIAQAKLAWRSNSDEYLARARETRAVAKRVKANVEGYPKLIYKCYDDATLMDLSALRRAHEQLADDSVASDLVWLTLVAILRRTSHVGTAQWQYVLPKKHKRNAQDAFSAFDQCAQMIYHDMQRGESLSGPRAMFIESDARTCQGVADHIANLVITSPPYPNNFDYADATRLEMSFMREIEGWGDLQSKIRRHLVRSCSQHVPEKTIDLDEVLAAPEVQPIRGPLSEVCRELATIRKTKGGKKTYHLMVACYFRDLANVWTSLRRVCSADAQLCFVIGDSAPYGVYVSVVPWLSALAEAAGFRAPRFERTRERNTKWKNRKHRVPLQEGRLWVEG